MLRNVLAVVLGLCAGMAFNMGISQLNMMVLYPMPAGMDWNDAAKVSAYIGALPTAAFVVVLVAHLGQAFVGGWVAARVGASKPVLLALTIGVLSLAAGIANAMQIPMPKWMYIEMPLYLAVAWLAGRLEEARRARTTSGASATGVAAA